MIKIRPIYHQTERRIRAHIFIGVIAYLMEKILYQKIRSLGITPQDALRFGREVKLVELKKVVTK